MNHFPSHMPQTTNPKSQSLNPSNQVREAAIKALGDFVGHGQPDAVIGVAHRLTHPDSVVRSSTVKGLCKLARESPETPRP